MTLNHDEYKSFLNRNDNDNDDDDDYPPNFTSIMQEQEKCKQIYFFKSKRFIVVVFF